MTEDKKLSKVNEDIQDSQEKDEKEKAHDKSISPSFVNNPITHAHVLDIDTRVAIPSEDDVRNVKIWSDDKNKT